jgi:hypothetical protein
LMLPMRNHPSLIQFSHQVGQCSKRQIDVANEESSIADTMILPPGWTMHRPMFHLSKRQGEWSTFLGEYFHEPGCLSQLCLKVGGRYIFESGESEWVQASVDRADELGFSRVDVVCGAIIPTERVGDRNMSRQSTDLFRCHPSFHSYPYLPWSWHDWAMIKWQPHMERNRIIWLLLICFRQAISALCWQHNPAKGGSSDILSIRIKTREKDPLLKFAIGNTLDQLPLCCPVWKTWRMISH